MHFGSTGTLKAADKGSKDKATMFFKETGVTLKRRPCILDRKQGEIFEALYFLLKVQAHQTANPFERSLKRKELKGYPARKELAREKLSKTVSVLTVTQRML